MLRKDCLELLQFAKDKGLFVMLNTNGSLLGKNIAQLSKSCDDVLVSLNTCNAEQEASLAETLVGKSFFEKKIASIKQLLKQKTFIRASTILSKQNIENLESFHHLLKEIGLKHWTLLRPIPCPENPVPIDRNDSKKAVEKIISLNALQKQNYFIENALPFCCYYPSKVEKVALGAINEDGNSKLVVDVTGQIKPSYFFDLSLGNALKDDFATPWNNEFMQKLHSLEFIAEPCHKCKFLPKCRSGSRFAAFFSNKDLYSLDPLASPNSFPTALFGKAK